MLEVPKLRSGLGSGRERRASHRFPIGYPLRWETLDHPTKRNHGFGETINVSSSGVLFTTETQLPLGSKIQLSIRWPVKLNDQCFINLIIVGFVVRHCRGSQLALQFKSYEFRTQGAAAAGGSSSA